MRIWELEMSQVKEWGSIMRDVEPTQSKGSDTSSSISLSLCFVPSFSPFLFFSFSVWG